MKVLDKLTPQHIQEIEADKIRFAIHGLTRVEKKILETLIEREIARTYGEHVDCPNELDRPEREYLTILMNLDRKVKGKE